MRALLIAAALALASAALAGISAARMSWGPDRTVAAARPPVSVPALAGTGSSSASASTPDGTTSSGTTHTTTTPQSRAPSGPVRNGPSATATLETEATPNGYLTSGGALDRNSGPTWSQDNVTITSAKPIVELTVTVTVVLTPGVTAHGSFTTAPNDDIATTVTRTATSLVYSFRLADGKKLVPGDYLFAAQFAHKPGRDNTDSYTVAARTAEDTAELSGDFVR